MDPRCREMMVGRCWHRAPLPTLARRDGDDAPEPNGHAEYDTSEEGEIHPELFADEATRVRLGFDPIPAE